jgi:hypothetical protein
MFNILVIVVLLLLGILGYNFKINEVHIAGIVLMCVSLCYLILAFIHDLSYYSNQLQRFESVRNYLKLINIYKEKQSELLIDFKSYLGEKYPDFEKQIFKNINESKSDMHIVLKYPELESSKTIMKLADEINKLADAVYSLREKVEYRCEDIRYYKNGKWEIIKPIIPKDIYNVVYSELKP